jgi:hypothetical protein
LAEVRLWVQLVLILTIPVTSGWVVTHSDARIFGGCTEEKEQHHYSRVSDVFL